jgi:KTSC domain
MPSAVIRDFRYEESRNELTVSFTIGTVYVYALVPPAVAGAFAAAPSKGSFFNDNIRDRYPHRKGKADGTPGSFKDLLSRSSDS